MIVKEIYEKVDMIDEMNDVKLLSTIICMICDYSVKNNMNPDESIKIVGENLLKLGGISTFKNWEIEK